jgi:hypothetical protein
MSEHDNIERHTVLHYDPVRTSARGVTPESWLCLDCGTNTAPGMPTRKQVDIAMLIHGSAPCTITPDSEVYTVTQEVWGATGLEDMGGCLCIGCPEKRIGRRLKPIDFIPDHPFNEPDFPASKRLRKRRGPI